MLSPGDDVGPVSFIVFNLNQMSFGSSTSEVDVFLDSGTLLRCKLFWNGITPGGCINTNSTRMFLNYTHFTVCNIPGDENHIH